jgi:site-specific DNA-methyltransferase (adenine-specific)
MTHQVHHGDCRDIIATLPADSVPAIVTDGPYHLTSKWSSGFMDVEWDRGDVAFKPETWAAMLRVAKPGAHLVAFGSPRTSHRQTCAIEDAGWELRDNLSWLYGSGWPKSLDVSKAIDGQVLLGSSNSRYLKQVNEQRPGEGRTRSSTVTDGVMGKQGGEKVTRDEPATPQGAAWRGWGTALKPGYEPILLARKPFTASVAQNTLEHGVGGMNIDGCRTERLVDGKGGWPGNVLIDEEAAVLLDAEFNGASRFFYTAKASKSERTHSGTIDNQHKTVKPLALMRWLVRLVTPTGGWVLDPFCGSGSTLVAAKLEGFGAVGIDSNEEAVRTSRARLTASERVL